MFRIGSNSPDPNSPQADIGGATPEPSAYQTNESYLPKAVSESATIAREIKEGTLSAFVGSATAITGQASFKSMLRVDGHFMGRISSDEGTLIVAAGGRVDANVAVAVARIHGTVIGDIVANDRIELGRGAKVTGNIQAPSLLIEPGAVLDGSCRMTPQPAVSEPEVVPVILAEQAIAAPESTSEEKVIAETPPKVERKENVLGTKARRTRARAATAKSDAEPLADAMTG